MLNSPKPTISVIGCGVIGLCSGIRLLEAGFDVRIVARELPPHTTSNWAAAIWLPFRVSPRELALRWGKATFDVLQSLMDIPESGVDTTTLFDLSAEPLPTPWWHSAIDSYRHAEPHELPDGYADAYVVEMPMMDTAIYLDYLVEWFKRLGGTIEQRTLKPDDIDTLGPIVVNCAGLGSHTLVADPDVYPIRGQIAVAERTLDASYNDLYGPNSVGYIFTRRQEMVLGGTAIEHDWREVVDEATSAEIIRRTTTIAPHMTQPKIIREGVGLRPGRHAVRLESETTVAGTTLIHNYGHGGAGFTLSWGCADDVVTLVQATQSIQNTPTGKM